MKRTLSLLLIILAIVALFTACQNEHTHNFTEWSTTKNPTCTEDGQKTRYCSCGERQSDTLPYFGHNYVDGVCERCGDIKSFEDPVNPEKPTCTHSNTEIIEAVAATCTETGLTEGEKCSDCQEIIKKQETVSAKGHNEVVDLAVDSTCTETGLTEGKHCSVCGEVTKAQEAIDALGHDIVIDESKAPTCTNTGLTEGEHCTRCDHKVEQEIISAKGHTDENPKNFICDICDADLCTDHTEEIIPAKAATCTEPGLTEGKKCYICGEILVAQETVKALGHTEVTDAAVAPDCQNSGLTEGKHCSICDEIIVKQETVPAKGHAYKNSICENCGDSNLKFELNTDGKSFSVKGIGTCTETDIVIPSYYNGLPVTNIGGYAFGLCSEITSIIIPDTVEKICEHAFWNCSNLVVIAIPNSVKIIENEAFRYCTSLVSIFIPDSVENIGGRTFQGCSNLEEVRLSNNIKSIEHNSFDSCYNLTEIDIPNSVISIGNSAFWNCSSLASIYIPENINSIGIRAFDACYNLSNITVDKNNTVYTSINGSLYKYSESNTNVELIQYSIGKSEQTLTIPDNVIKINDYALYGCLNLINIIIPDSVSYIGNYAFYNCTNLENVTIGNSVSSIGDYAFQRCINLKTIIIGNGITNIGNYTFSSCSNLSNIYYKGSEEDWKAVIIGSSNNSLKNATIHYNYVPEE